MQFLGLPGPLTCAELLYIEGTEFRCGLLGGKSGIHVCYECRRGGLAGRRALRLKAGSQLAAAWPYAFARFVDIGTASLRPQPDRIPKAHGLGGSRMRIVRQSGYTKREANFLESHVVPPFQYSRHITTCLCTKADAAEARSSGASATLSNRNPSLAHEEALRA
ncbi:MAG TPA: hypothetical protein VNS34_09315 [Rhizobiaceae bacterium]|nr:hypothetical protein [Rhizobiaceae bacterium]